jgi:hypothetical protein
VTYSPFAPLTNPEGWRGVWVRDHSGPNLKGTLGRVTVGSWHVVLGVTRDGYSDDSRLRLAHVRPGPALWPSGGHRLEVARPIDPALLPGVVCERCLEHFSFTTKKQAILDAPVRVRLRPEVEDAMAERVAERLLDDDLVETVAQRVIDRLLEMGKETS